MSTNKTKSELVAIYRLEFYKKQNNWKLSSNKIEKPQKCTKRKTLNTTYNIEDKQQKQNESDPMNVAFVDSDSDKNSVVKPPKSPELSLACLESINIWPENIASNTIKPKTVQRLENLQKAASLHKDNETNIIPQNLPMRPECQQTPRINNTSCLQDLVMGWNACGEFEGNWPMETAVFIGAGHRAEGSWKQGANNVNEVDGLQDIYSNQWPSTVPMDELQLSMDMDMDTSVDSAGEFMRGADMAPHSSEIDLALPNCLKACDVSYTSLSRLSSTQLVQAARQHSRVLRRLIIESDTRQKLITSQTLSTTNFSNDEFPTRDDGPSSPFGEMSFKDVLISGSHRNLAVGRGRGRFTNNGLD